MTFPRRKTIRWHEAASADVAAIVDHIATKSPQAAKKFAEKIIERVDRLAYFPYLGPVCPSYRRARLLVQGNHAIYYTVHRTEVVVRAVVHGARIFQPSWFRRGE